MNVEISKSDITLVVDGQEFHCLKENLSRNSTYFESMFFSNFAEKDQEKVELKDIQVCSSIQDAYELDEVVPKDLDSFCNATKNIVLQRSFELLGVRKSPLPPQPEHPELVFGEMMNEFVDQAELQNHHGMILADQAALIKGHIAYEEYIDRTLPEAKPMIQQDPRIHELMEDLRNTHDAAERNAVRAQILIVKLKNIYTTLSGMGAASEHPLSEGILFNLESSYRIILRNQRNHFKSAPSVRGEKLIDQMYRRIMENVDDSLPTEAVPLNNGTKPIWVTKIREESDQLLPYRTGISKKDSARISEGRREVSKEASFPGLVRFVQMARESFYMGWKRRKEDN
ncbi:unnamed protein product [Caenorhabditis brenneri]